VSQPNSQPATPVISRLGAFLRGTLQNYDPGNYPPRQAVSDALEDCDQLEMRRTDRGNLRPVSSGNMFNCVNVHAALEDPDAEQELQIIIQAVPLEDWPAISLLARAYWPTASPWLISDLLQVPGDLPKKISGD
jgi:hypothetical protein